MCFPGNLIRGGHAVHIKSLQHTVSTTRSRDTTVCSIVFSSTQKHYKASTTQSRYTIAWSIGFYNILQFTTELYRTVEVGSLHTLMFESLKLVFQPLHKFLVNKL